MDTLFKNSRLPLFAALLCLLFLAMPVQGSQRMPQEPQSPAEHEFRKKDSRPNGQTPSDLGNSRNGRGGQEHKTDFKPHSRRDKNGPDNQALPKPTVSEQGAFKGAPGSGGRSTASANTAKMAPAPGPERRDRGPKRFSNDAADRHPNQKRGAVHAAQPRQQITVQQSLFVSRDTGRHNEHRDRGRSSTVYQRDYRQVKDSGKRSPQVRHDGGKGHRPVIVKRVVHKIPSRHAVVVHGRDRYHYYSGRFYRPWNSGFILVRPPLGLVVLNIPLGSRMVLSAGITYHVFGDVYYRRVPTGYQVVEPIRSHIANRPDRVEVVIDLLNVRYGPETNEEVISQVGRYTVLRVLGSAPGWLYVEVEGEEDLRGWVMERYVSSARGLG